MLEPLETSKHIYFVQYLPMISSSTLRHLDRPSPLVTKAFDPENGRIH
jgi:hypothetical protein